jgi:Tol biopolymer transport system component
MGDVYRAHDARLGRDVAVKVLPEQFSKDADRLRRFEQEARSTGILNHPNILAIHDVGSREGAPFIVSELLEGETLRSAHSGGAIGPRRAIDYAGQIAKGLAAAHEKGFVHRDLKPENLFVTKDGRIKILDFGLAKLIEDAGDGRSQLPTVASEPGAVLGTVGYMAPEQVRGQAVDHRADIFAFGVILYEMLSGVRAFHRESAVETMSAILKEEPAEIPTGTVPPGLDRIMRRCLEKQMERRFQSASDLGFALEALSGSAVMPASTERVRRYSWKTIAAVSVAAIVIVLAFVAVRTWEAPYTALPTEWHGEQLSGPPFAWGPRISPDGNMIAFIAMNNGDSRAAVMTLVSRDWSSQSGGNTDRGGIGEVSWSNDGARVLFNRFFEQPRGIFSVPAIGDGDERLVLEDAMWPKPLPDGSLIVTRINAGAKQLYRYWPETRHDEPLGALISAPLLNSAVAAAPGGREVVFFGKPAGSDATEDHLYALDLSTKRVRQVAPAAARLGVDDWVFPLAVTRDGKHVLFNLPAGDLRRIVAAPLDGSDRLQTIVTLTELPIYLDAGPDGSIYLDQLDASPELLIYSPADGRQQRFPMSPGSDAPIPLSDGQLVMTSRSAGRSRLIAMRPGGDGKPFVQTEDETAGPVTMLGRDLVAFLQGSGDSQGIAIATLDGRPLRKLARVKGTIEALAGSPDGKTLFYVTAGEVWRIPADDSEPAQKIRPGVQVAVDPHGRYLVIEAVEQDTNRLIRVPLDGGAEEPIVIKSDFRLAPQGSDALSPQAVASDGRILIRITARESAWYWPAAILHPETGRLDVIPPGFSLDMSPTSWDAQGRIVTGANSARSTLWRFRPVKP